MTDQTKEKVGFASYLLQAWLVLALSVCFGTALAVVEKFTRPMIEQNTKDRIARKLVEMFGEGTTTDDPVIVEAKIGKRSRPSKIKCYPAIKDAKRVGWGVLATGRGYDTLTLLVGLDPAAQTLTGYRVIKSMETAGIGDKIKRQAFYQQFEGRPTAEALKLVGAEDEVGKGEVHAISGATVSSTGVVRIVNQYVAAVKEQLAAEAGKEP